MATEAPAAGTPTTDAPAAGIDGWRRRAVDRSLRKAQERAVSRSERFIEVATGILHDTGNLDFTVHELVERSGLSLRAFYQHFAGKDELLLAVAEEAIGRFVERLRDRIDAEADPYEKLHLFVTGFYGAGAGADHRASAALSRYVLMLTSQSPGDLARVLRPQLELLSEIVEAGVAAGRLRADLSPPVLTFLVNQTVMSAVETNVLGAHLTGHSLEASDLWAFCQAAVTAPDLRPVRARR